VIPTRWRKVIADFSSNKIRTLLVICSIAIGVFALGTISTMYITLMQDMEKDYQAANPHSAMIYAAPFNHEVVNSIQRMPEIHQAEGRGTLVARLETKPGETRYPLSLTSIPKDGILKIDQLRPESPPKTLPYLLDKEMYLERTALSQVRVKPGDKVRVITTDGKIRELTIRAIVHDVTSFSYMFTGQITGYVNPETMKWLGGSTQYNQLLFTVANHPQDETHVTEIAKRVADKLENGGLKVYSTIVYKPGEHPISHLFRTGLYIIGGFGILVMFLSAFLVINTITALLSQHTQQIGVMKSFGGQSTHVASMYITLVFLFGIIGFGLAVPAGAIAAYRFSFIFAEMFNFNMSGFNLPLETILLQFFVAVVVPVSSAIIPVLRGAGMTVREAISLYGLGGASTRKDQFDQLFERIRGLPRPLLLSLRNAFRKKTRMALTLTTLTLGGAIFIAVFNVQSSISLAINQSLGYFLSDLNITFSQPYRTQQVEPLVRSIPGVVEVEGWNIQNAQILSPDKSTGTEVRLVAPPVQSNLITPIITRGRWLLPGDENALVIGNHFLEKRPDVQLGDELIMKLNGKETKWKVVGIYQLAGTVFPPYVYASYEYVSRTLSLIDQAASFRVVTYPQDVKTQSSIMHILEDRFKSSGLQVSAMVTGEELHSQEVAQFNILIYILLVVAILITLVGALGLTSTMSMNILERTREIGVMRAIGATNPIIMRMVIAEGLMVGLFSGGLGSLLSLPVSQVLGYVIGNSFMSSPLHFSFSWQGWLLWLGGSLLIAALASLIPARTAVQMTIREVITYE